MGHRYIRRGGATTSPPGCALFCSLAHGVRARGDERLSGSQAGDARDGGKAPAASRSPKERKKDRTNVVGRALRTVYDETLREDIPGDFLALLGKLA